MKVEINDYNTYDKRDAFSTISWGSKGALISGTGGFGAAGSWVLFKVKFQQIYITLLADK